MHLVVQIWCLYLYRYQFFFLVYIVLMVYISALPPTKKGFTMALFQNIFGPLRNMLFSTGEDQKGDQITLTASCEKGAFITIETLYPASIKTELVEDYLAAVKNAGLIDKVEVLSFPTDLSEAGQILQAHKKEPLKDMSPEEALNLTISDKIEALPHIKRKLAEGTLIMCENYWVADVAKAVAAGLDLNRCLELIPKSIKEIVNCAIVVDSNWKGTPDDKPQKELKEIYHILRDNKDESFTRTHKIPLMEVNVNMNF